MSYKKKLKYLFGLICILLLVAGYTSNFFSVVYELTKQAIRSSMPVTVTHIGGAEYAIPRDYILWGLRDVENEFSIGIIWPDMEGVVRDIDRKHHAFDQEVFISATDVKSTSTISSSFQYLLGERKTFADYQYLDEAYGLHHYRANKVLPLYDVPVDDLLYKNEIYTDANSEDSASIMINCNGDKPYPAPGCNIRFVDRGLLYNITIRKTRLSEWQEIKGKVLLLVDGFRHPRSSSIQN